MPDRGVDPIVDAGSDPVPGAGGDAGDDPVVGWVMAAARAADSKTEEATVVLDVGEVLGITGYFVVTGGRNDRQVKTIAQEVEVAVAAAGGPKVLRREGLDTLRWVLLDFGDFVVHVMVDEARSYYELERLWADVAHLDWAGAPGQAVGPLSM